MGDVGLGLSYLLPRTEFVVEVSERTEVQLRSDAHWLTTVADARVTPAAVADPNSRQVLTVDAGLLEKISLVVTLDDRGFITAVNSESGKDISPIISLVGKAVSLAAAISMMGFRRVARAPESSLEDQWNKARPKLEQLRTALDEQTQRLLSRMADKDTAIGELDDLGEALEAVQAQLATLSEARRAWIAGQAKDVAKRSWRLYPADLYRVPGSTLPESIDAPISMPPATKEMVDGYGMLVATADPDRATDKTPSSPMKRDHIALRRSRPAVLGVYTRDSESVWRLNAESVRFLDVVDDYSPTDPLSIDGSWWRQKKFELAYHPDMSLKSFGVTTSSSVSAVAASTGDLLDALAESGKSISAGPSEADKELAKAKTQLDLLQTASDYEILAATRNRAAELAALEQQKKLREAQS